uniref:Uncharacterized protein n=1 Tax=Arundo donax TaxID=35708 RepID=A0A0A8ZIG5_ARUDO
MSLMQRIIIKKKNRVRWYINLCSSRVEVGVKAYNPAETNPCNVMIPHTTLLSSTTGKNCTGEGGDSIFSIASTAIASAVIVLGFLKHKAGQLDNASVSISY